MYIDGNLPEVRTAKLCLIFIDIPFLAESRTNIIVWKTAIMVALRLVHLFDEFALQRAW